MKSGKLLKAYSFLLPSTQGSCCGVFWFSQPTVKRICRRAPQQGAEICCTTATHLLKSYLNFPHFRHARSRGFNGLRLLHDNNKANVVHALNTPHLIYTRSPNRAELRRNPLLHYGHFGGRKTKPSTKN